MRTAWTLAATALAVTIGPAGLAEAQPQNPSDVIEQLELTGYTVNIDRIGSAPIEDCTVAGIRNPQQITEPAVVDGRGRRDGDREVIEVVVRQSISVSLDCTH